MKYSTITIQGNLISEEILQKIEQGKAEGQSPKDFGLDSLISLRNEIEYAWSRIKLDWKHFTEKSQSLPTTDPYGTTLSRRWMEQFLNAIGFELLKQKASLPGDNHQHYAISHTEENLDSLPIHIVGFYAPDTREGVNTLDIKSSGGTSRLSPHATVQEYLNVTDHVYGIAANGLFIRLIRDSGRLIKLTYLEFDLKRMLEEDKYSEFSLLYRLLHASRFPANKQEAGQSLLEKYYRESIETGNRIRDGLSNAVKNSLLALGRGFLQHENNKELREKIQANRVTPKEYYRQLLRIIYRLLFLMVTEERDLVYPDISSEAERPTMRLKKFYLQFYSIARLRKLSENRFLYENQFTDLWLGLLNSFRLFEADGSGKKLGILPLDGDLFGNQAITDLQDCLINNKLLLECIRNLNEFEDENGNLVPINYRSLDVEELGSVYEGLLELLPFIENAEASNPNQIDFIFREGTDRKTTGSYYTKPELVNELIKSSLISVIEERLKEKAGNKEEQTKALLKLKVCDPAAGSGHILLTAARTIAWYLAKVQSGEENPAPSVYRNCLREVIQHCIYAVDMNPDAVELCKLALWLEGHNNGKPLTFLDHKIRNGNSLIGVTDLSILQKGIPNEAYTAVTGDDKEVCTQLKTKNTQYQKTKQTTLDFEQRKPIDTQAITGDYRELDSIRQDDVEGVKQAKRKFSQLRSNREWFNDWRACNLWTSAFFWNYVEENKQAAPNSERLASFLTNPAAAYGPMAGKADALALEHKFFHWPLEFPDVFEQGGFDVILGNPPWEIVELNAKEFFRYRDNEITNASSDKNRKILIDALKGKDNALYKSFQKEKHNFDSQRRFIQKSNRFPKGSIGRIDLYPLFVENSLKLIQNEGISGLIVPSDIATGAYNASLFSSIVEEKRLKCFFDFENSKPIFPSVHRSKRFCLLSLTGSRYNNSVIDFFYFGHDLSDLLDKTRRISLKIFELELFSPNTLAPPIFHTSLDYDLAKKVYHKLGVFINKKKTSNPWNASIKRMLSLSDAGVDFIKNDTKLEDRDNIVRMYSGKNISQYNHRFATYKDGDTYDIEQPLLKDPSFVIQTEYYVPQKELENRIGNKKPSNWIIGYRDVTNATNERTTISAILPRVACDTNCRNIYSDLDITKLCCLLGNLNSIPFDYFARQKIMGLHLNAGTLEQLPVLTPDIFTNEVSKKIVANIFELTFVSWDIKPFADDVWKEADGDLKAILQQQWEANKTATGGHPSNPPAWCQIDVAGCQLPPFKWDEERRAVLKADLDAIYAKLYGFTMQELRYILDPQDVCGSNFPGETFRVLKEKEIRQYGEYRTRRLVLEAWERLNNSELVISF